MGHIYGQLSQKERLMIFHYKHIGYSLRHIAMCLGRSASTIGREITRNSKPNNHWKGDYCPVRAQKLTARRRQIDKSRFKLVRQPDLQVTVRKRLAMGWSPKQISGRLALLHGAPVISHESIYRYIYYRREQKDYLCRFLAKAHSRRRRRSKRPKPIISIPWRTSLSERPEHINTRKQTGHWEVDMMQFSKPTHSLLMLCERKSRFIKTSIHSDKKAITIKNALIKQLEQVPVPMRQSMTFDNGSEFWLHNDVAKLFNLKTYFCDPYSPWQKGSVENAIGRLRRYLPRKVNISQLCSLKLERIINDYNNTPRQCLDFQTPLEVYSKNNVALQT